MVMCPLLFRIGIFCKTVVSNVIGEAMVCFLPLFGDNMKIAF